MKTNVAVLATAALLTRHEASGYLRVSLTSLYHLTASGQLPSVSLGRRRLYRKTDLDAFVEANTNGAA